MLFRRPGKEPLSGGHITPFAQEKVDGSTMPINGAIEVDPLATNLNISLVYAPGIADRPRITAPALLKFRDIPLHPPQNGRMGQGDAALGHHLDEIAGAELKRQIPPHAQDDDFLVKVPPFEEILCRGRFRHPSRYRKTPSVSTVCTRTDQDRATLLEKILEAAIEKVGVFNPAPTQPGARVGWSVVPCVLDLGKDTEGPPIEMPGKKMDPEEGQQFLKAASNFAESKGAKVTTEAGGGGMGESGAVAVYRRRDGSTEEKIYLARWAGLTEHCKTVLHEIAHFLAGHHRLNKSKPEIKKEQSKAHEHIAEATAYVVGRQFGVPMEYSAAYLKNWGATPADLENHLTTVRDLAKEMIVGIEQHLGMIRREEQVTQAKTISQPSKPVLEPVAETYVRYRGRIYGEDQVNDLIAAFGASNNLTGERIEVLRNNALTGEKPRWEPIERLSARNYQTRLLMEYAEVAAESEGAKYVWIESDGSFGYAIDPDDVPENVQSVQLDQTLAVGAAV
jgi:Zincin-like metallopeptidase